MFMLERSECVNRGMYILLHNAALAMSALGHQRTLRSLALQGPLSSVNRPYSSEFLKVGI